VHDDADTFPLYILDGTQPVPCPDVRIWGRWFDTTDRTVARTQVTPGIEVSTVFLGFDRAYPCHGPPVLFETLVMGDPLDNAQARYITWQQAE
jgi:hypothetical protein